MSFMILKGGESYNNWVNRPVRSNVNHTRAEHCNQQKEPNMKADSD